MTTKARKPDVVEWEPATGETALAGLLATTCVEEARGELEPTKTYSRRSWSWLAAPGSHMVDRDGTLTVMQTSGRRVLRTEVSHYAVQVERDEFLPPGVWAFLLENEMDPDEYGPFRCIVGGMADCCGCESGWFDGRREPDRRTGCKHRSALLAMLDAGVFDG